VRLLQIDLYNNMLSSDISMISSNGFAMFLNFLKIYYNNKQIFNIFKKGLSEIHETLKDCVNLYSVIDKDFLHENFEKEACNLCAIHDELIRIDRLFIHKKSCNGVCKQGVIMCIFQ